MQPELLTDEIVDQDEPAERYLVFTLGGEIYGTTLTSVKEVMKKTEIKTVPYMKSYFKGVINLRGRIISVVDLREKFKISPGEKSVDLMLVVENDQAFMAAIVDDVISVSVIKQDDIVQVSSASKSIPPQYFRGVGKINDSLVNMIQLDQILSNDDYAVIHRMKEAS